MASPTPHTPESLYVRTYTLTACGCYARRNAADASDPAHVVYCPTHAAAPALLALITEVADYPDAFMRHATFDRPLWKALSDKARAILRAVERA